MSKLTPTQFSRISQYIKMYEGNRKSLQYAWYNTWEEEDMEDYYDLNDSDVLKRLADLRYIIETEEYNIRDGKELLNDCEMIYKKWLIKNKTK